VWAIGWPRRRRKRIRSREREPSRLSFSAPGQCQALFCALLVGTDKNNQCIPKLHRELPFLQKSVRKFTATLHRPPLQNAA
jgi:hypothetical protein